MKHIFFNFFVSLLFLTVLSCKTPNTEYYRIAGFIQGTTYHITYLDPQGRDLKSDVESILADFDKSLSTYDSMSIVSRINRNEPGVVPDMHFFRVFNTSREVNKKSGGLFDITVAPLVNAWGFGFTAKKEVDSATIDSLLPFVGMDKVKIENNKVIKSSPGMMLDFNAIAQGYSVDVVAEHLEKLKIRNYLVEIGGEIRAKGKNPKNETWKIGIDKPIDNNNIPGASLQNILQINDCSLATSGNYRKFFEKEGKKYTHFIDPRNGYPIYSNLLSVTVIAGDCMTADAYATAFMIMGLDKAKEFLTQNPHFEAYMIFSDEDGNFGTYSTEGIKRMLIE